MSFEIGLYAIAVFFLLLSIGFGLYAFRKRKEGINSSTESGLLSILFFAFFIFMALIIRSLKPFLLTLKNDLWLAAVIFLAVGISWGIAARVYQRRGRKNKSLNAIGNSFLMLLFFGFFVLLATHAE